MSTGFLKSTKLPLACPTHKNNPKILKGWQWTDLSEKNIVGEYFQATGFHGFQYIGQNGRHIFERIFWILATLAAITGAVMLIYKLYNGYMNMPIVTVFSSQEKQIHEISFPSVTICNVNSIQKSKVEEYFRKVINDSNEKPVNDTDILQTYAALADYQQICYGSLTMLGKFSYEKSGKFFFEMPKHIQSELTKRETEYRKYRGRENVYKISQSCEDMILFCALKNIVRNCSELFKKVSTDFGFCCTFNAIPASILTRDENLEDKEEPTSSYWKEIIDDNLLSSKATGDFPFRQMHGGRNAGLSFLVNPELKEYTCTNMDSDGFLLSLSHPFDYPSMGSSSEIAIPVDSEVMIGVRPQVIEPDSSMKHFNPDVRSCYLTNEFSLKYFTKYTKLNCLLECLSDVTVNACGCVYYFMPNGANHKLCTTYEDVECLRKQKEKFSAHPLTKFCPKCLPTCTQINYYPESSSLKIRQEHLDKLRENVPELYEMRLFNFMKNLSIVHIFISTGSVFPMLRKEVYTTIDLVSNAGGILGLCMGFSLLSLLEIVYYFSLRIVCNHYRRKNLPEYGMSGGDIERKEIAQGSITKVEIDQLFQKGVSSKVLERVEENAHGKMDEAKFTNWF